MGVDVNVQGGAGLRRAASLASPHAKDTVKVLLRHGAKPTACDGELLCQLMQEGKEMTVQLLVEHGAEVKKQEPTC
jgi:hypothetical protein